MQITRVLNTNAVLSADSDSNEIVLLGRGIGFKARPGDNVDETKIEKRFTLNDKKQLSRFRELLEQIPSEYIFVAEQAISFAKRFYNLQLNESIHISLADHLHSAVENARACEKTRVFSCVLLLMVIIIVILHKKGYSSPYPIRMLL